MNTLTLNLQFPERSDILFKVNMFPDGQRSITILEDQVSKLYKKVNILVVKSICSFADLELILSAASAISKHTTTYSLYAPYIIGGRSDRKFEVGGDMYLEEVMLRSLDMAGFSSIHTVDFHTRTKILRDYSLSMFTEEKPHSFSGVIYPDESARKKYGFNCDTSCTFFKERLPDGTVKQVPSDDTAFINIIRCENITIRDDIFDGGKSFIELVRKIRVEHKSSSKITIKVSHFIGSNKEILEELESFGVRIVTSNSYTPINTYPHMSIIDVFDIEPIFGR